MSTAILHIQPVAKTESLRFDIEKLNQYTLSCEISESSFYCKIIEPLDNEVIVTEKYEFPSSKEVGSVTNYLTSIYDTHDFLNEDLEFTGVPAQHLKLNGKISFRYESE